MPKEGESICLQAEGLEATQGMPTPAAKPIQLDRIFRHKAVSAIREQITLRLNQDG